MIKSMIRINSAQEDRISFCAVSGSTGQQSQEHTTSGEDEMIRLTILGISILCYSLCQVLSSALSHDNESKHHSVLESSKRALPTKEAIRRQ